MRRLLVVLAAVLVAPALPAGAAREARGLTFERYLAAMSWPVRASTGRAQSVSDAIKGSVSPGDPPFLGMVAEGCDKFRDVEEVGRTTGVGAMLLVAPPSSLAKAHAILARAYSAARAGCVRARDVALALRRALGRLGINPSEDELARVRGPALRKLVDFDRTKLRPFKGAVRAWRAAALRHAAAVGVKPPDWLKSLRVPT